MATLIDTNVVSLPRDWDRIANVGFQEVQSISSYLVGDVGVVVTRSITTYDDGVVENLIEINPEEAVDGIPGWICGDADDILVQKALLTLTL